MTKVLKPKPSDIPEILKLVNSDAKHLIPRKKSEIRTRLTFWRIIKVGKQVVACGCFDRYSSRMAEIRSFIVHPQHRGQDYGQALLTELLAFSQKGQSVFVVTSIPEYFKKQKFSECLQEKYILFYQ